MKKHIVLTFCILFMWITVHISASCGDEDWNQCHKYKKRKSYNRWCSCETDTTEKPPIPTPLPTPTPTPLPTPIPTPLPTPKPTQPPIPKNDTEDESCAPYNPPTPDFSFPGQRISVTKCYEYMWQMQVRIQRGERKKKCYESKLNHGIHVYKRNAEIKASERYQLDYEYITNNSHISKREADVGTSIESHEQVEMTLYVMGGRDARPKEFPHMGAVGWRSSDPNKDWKFMCGSTLLSPKFALSAAHCTRTSPHDTSILDPIPKIIRFGVEDLVLKESFHTVDLYSAVNGDAENMQPVSIRLTEAHHNAEDRNISKIIPHPDYRSPLRYYDIALFELDRPIVFSKYVQPACLWTEDMSKVKEGTVTGWGVTKPGDREAHRYLQAATLDTVDPKTCEEKLGQYHNRRWPELVDTQFCAGQMVGGVDTCQGDSGGPFQKKIPLPPQVVKKEGNLHHVIGVTSFGIGCGLKDVPGVYTKVQSFLDFIEPIVWP